jgi:hypothetical protein
MMQKNGLITRAVGDALALCPPLIVTEEQIHEIFDIYERASTKPRPGCAPTTSGRRNTSRADADPPVRHCRARARPAPHTLASWTTVMTAQAGIPGDAPVAPISSLR